MNANWHHFFTTAVFIHSEMLQMRLADALEVPEIDWESPRIKEWIGNPGANRVALFAGLECAFSPPTPPPSPPHLRVARACVHSLLYVVESCGPSGWGGGARRREGGVG